MKKGTLGVSRKSRSAWISWWRSPTLYRLSIFLGTVLVLTWLFTRGDRLEYQYALNEITKETLIAPFTFPILKSPEVLARERELAKASVPLLFRKDRTISDFQLAGLEELFLMVQKIRRTNEKLAISREEAYRYKYDERFPEVQRRVVRDSTESVGLMMSFSERFPLDLNGASWQTFLRRTTTQFPELEKESTQLLRSLETIIRDILTEGVLDLSLRQIGTAPVAIATEGVEAAVEHQYLVDLDQAWAKAKTRLMAIYSGEAAVERNVGFDLLVYFIRPNLLYDSETTLRRQQEAVGKVPPSKGIQLKDEAIVYANTRVTPELLEILQSLAAAKTQKIAEEGGLRFWLPNIGMGLLSTIILAFYFVWLFVYRKAWFQQNRILLLTSLLFILIMGMGALFYHRLELSEYLIPFTVAAMAFTIMFDARTAFIASVSLALLLGFLIGGRLNFVVVNLLVGSAAIYAVRHLRRRSQIFSAIIYIVAAYALGIIAVEALKYSTTTEILKELGYATVNGILSPIMVYGLIGVLEVIFGITTNLTLLELSDFNHPLLRRLSKEANGTFNHSIVVGNLAEAAANAIKANSLLCRVGAYYHDIGKITKSEYFIENQFHVTNRHDNLTPHLSSKVIISHVKEGLRLAKEYGLPKTVADFIPMHHGTTRVEYFYRKAVDQMDGKKKAVNENDFRYPGPVPNSKETGILMLCEAVEAATRSIKEPNLAKLQQMMDSIIENRVADKQLDNCPLTLQDLKRIKGDVHANTGMISVLRGIYHVRIPYPSSGKVKERGRVSPGKETLLEEPLTPRTGVGMAEGSGS